MIKIVKPKTDREESKISSNNTSDTPKIAKISPGLIRLQKDLATIDIPQNAKLDFKSKSDLTTFDVNIKPEEGSYWHGGIYCFTIKVPSDYPFLPPKVHCNTRIYHPNIDLSGNVCLNILRSDWKPVLDINNIILGLLFLFIEPNPNDPLNEEASEKMRNSPKEFAEFIKKTLKGLTYKNITFERFV